MIRKRESRNLHSIAVSVYTLQGDLKRNEVGGGGMEAEETKCRARQLSGSRRSKPAVVLKGKAETQVFLTLL